MKIYFEDGALNADFESKFNFAVRVDAGDGYTHCMSALEHLKDNNFNGNVYTNFLPAMRGVYSWDENLKLHQVFVRNIAGKFEQISNFTQRELRFAHNIPHLWECGEFEDNVNDE